LIAAVPRKIRTAPTDNIRLTTPGAGDSAVPLPKKHRTTKTRHQRQVERMSRTIMPRDQTPS
jgi:hypothetical protein